MGGESPPTLWLETDGDKDRPFGGVFSTGTVVDITVGFADFVGPTEGKRYLMFNVVGTGVGWNDSDKEGSAVGPKLGPSVGSTVGCTEDDGTKVVGASWIFRKGATSRTGFLVGLCPSAIDVVVAEGQAVGVAVGRTVGSMLGDTEGSAMGVRVGKFVGVRVGKFVGIRVGKFLGIRVGIFVGIRVGEFVGIRVGEFVGINIEGVVEELSPT